MSGPMLFELPLDELLPLLPSRRRALATFLRRAERAGESREQNANFYDILERIDRLLATGGRPRKDGEEQAAAKKRPSRKRKGG